jgi:hypothetical protein
LAAWRNNQINNSITNNNGNIGNLRRLFGQRANQLQLFPALPPSNNNQISNHSPGKNTASSSTFGNTGNTVTDSDAIGNGTMDLLELR